MGSFQMLMLLFEHGAQESPNPQRNVTSPQSDDARLPRAQRCHAVRMQVKLKCFPSGQDRNETGNLYKSRGNPTSNLEVPH